MATKVAPTNVLTPYLIVKDAARAIAFYSAIFGARELSRLDGPDGKIGHAELKIGDSLIMLADEHPDFGALSPASLGGSPVSLHLYVDNVDETIDSARSSGATVVREPKDEFYGDRAGMIVDPFGHKWQIATKKVEMSADDMKKRWRETFQA